MLVFGCAATLGLVGCGQQTGGNPKDFEGPLDTSKAITSEEAKEFPAGKVDDGSGNLVKPR